MSTKWRSERDLRQWLREQLGDGVIFIEPGAGGTEGIPDAYVLAYNLWVELKIAKWNKRTRTFDVDYRTSQLVIMDRMERFKTPVITLFGERCMSDLWYCHYHDMANYRQMRHKRAHNFFRHVAAEIEMADWDGDDLDDDAVRLS